EAREARDALLEQLEPLSAELWIYRAQSSDVPAWAGQGGDESRADRVVVDGHHNGDRRRRLSGHASRLRTSRDDDIDVRLHQLGCCLARQVEFAVSPSVINQDVSALDVTEIAKTLLQGLTAR